MDSEIGHLDRNTIGAVYGWHIWVPNRWVWCLEMSIGRSRGVEHVYSGDAWNHVGSIFGTAARSIMDQKDVVG